MWIAAPPGAGKTTLMAGYVEARGLRHIWYQVDAADSDPATFVYYMRLAALEIGRRNAVVPLFPPEPQQDLARFTRSFLRDLFAALPRPCAVVLDNFQEARASAEHRAALAQGLEEIPEGITVFIVSRVGPPPEYARLVASRFVGLVDERALRCELAEAEAILEGTALGEDVVRRILRQSEGWVAALVLLREHLSRHGVAIDESLGEGKEAIFRYFAGEIFNRAQPENQRMLMLTAIAPSTTEAEAVALTGNEDAPRLLDYLYRRHLFIDRRRSGQLTYQYHALFREYLRGEMRRRLPRDVRCGALVHAAGMLAERGQADEALELYREAEQWDAMREVICRHALEWARQGRAQGLSDWIDALPASRRASDPWLEYWYGRAWIFVQPQRGRPAVEHAFEVFRVIADVRGQSFAIAAIVTSYYYEWADFRPLDRWLPELERLLKGGQAAVLDRESELRARAAQLVALLFRQPDEAVLAQSAARLDALVDGESDVNVRMMAASILLNTYNWLSMTPAADALVSRTQPLLAGEEVGPLMQLWWRTNLSFWHYIAGRYAEAGNASDEARAVAERYGLEAYLFEIDHSRASALIHRGELAEAKVLIDALERRLVPTRRMDWAYLHYLRSMLAMRLGQYSAALREAERAVQLAHETGLPIGQVPQMLARVAHCRTATGDRAGGLRAMEEAIALASGADRIDLEAQRELLQIDGDISDGRIEQAVRRLGAVLEDRRKRGQQRFLRSHPALAARLLDFALVHGIESAYARELIQRNRIVPTPHPSDDWPFRLRVKVLGGFGLVRDGNAIRFSGKTQQRPLDLLKLIVALGGDGVDGQHVAAALWPDADGAAAKSSFDATLFRLRKLLDVEHAVKLSGGKITLSPELVWTDVRALETAIESARRAAQQADADVAAAAVRLIEAYPGALLGDEDTPWIAKPRDSLRSRFLRALMTLGEQLESRAEWTASIDLYRRALEADNLAEPVYRGLMRSLAAQGDVAEALNAYRRCRELLSIVLGVQPAAETERLHRRIAAVPSPPAQA